MKRWIFLLLALVLVSHLATMGVACKAKAPEKPAAKEEVKPPEAPVPAEPAAKPEAPAPEAPPKK